MQYDLANMTSPEAAEAVARSRTAVLPIGSIEQHGPHLPNGTDTFAAELVAREIADRLDAVYAPFGPYGVTPIHAGHPGTVTLRRETFEALLTDICTELIRMGVETFVLVNWHEGNIASMNAVATDLQDRYDCTFVAAQACYVAQRLYRDEGGELTHGGGIETLAMLAHDPELVKTERAGEPWLRSLRTTSLMSSRFVMSAPPSPNVPRFFWMMKLVATASLYSPCFQPGP